ncbi:MAG: non-ribosomal peptide synthetase [Dehalococcoidia bacterium]
MVATLLELVEAHAQSRPDAVAIEAPGRSPLTYRELLDEMHSIGRLLRSVGVAPTDRVAIVLPNGPEMAVAFLAVAAFAGSAPLNPAYRAPELDFYLTDLEPRVLLTQVDAMPVAAAVARAAGIEVLDARPVAEGPAGRMSIEADGVAPADQPPASPASPAAAADVALVLHTSGTTSRPKMVPLTQANVLASARHIATSLQLTEADRCLNVMPLFHIHGLIAAVLSSLYAGSAVRCTPGFDPMRFMGWLDEARPSWYTAVPTMHQSVLAQAARHPDVVARSSLRFVRSSSASLPAPLMAELESTLGAPVIEAYGMTEASHQMTSNPLPPRARKPGSVGLPAGPEVAVMDGSGTLLAQGEVGEVVIRGPNVTAGYLGAAEATAAAFTNGWFRTGDEGRFDEDGYLFLTGRLKEVINRGGETIAPREIDDVLSTHSDVAQAIAFAVPHPTLGEEVAAAVVLREGASTSAADLRSFVATQLSDAKVPKRIELVAEIPKGPTGKLQRIGLAERLGLAGDAATSLPAARRGYEEPATELESELARVWCDVLGVEQVGRHDEFVDLGGDSLSAVELFLELEAQLNLRVTMASLFTAPTIAEQAALIEAADGGTDAGRCLVTLRGRGPGSPLAMVHGIHGTADLFYRFAAALPDGFPVYAFQSVGVDGAQPPLATIEEMAQRYLSELRAVQPVGPYRLAGASFGGIVAFEMAQRLERAGERVEFLGLLDARLVEPAPRPAAATLGQRLDLAIAKARFHTRHLRARDWEGRRRYLLGRLRRPRGPVERSEIFLANERAKHAYVPGPYRGAAVLFRTDNPEPWLERREDYGWQTLCEGGLSIVPIAGDHQDFVAEHSADLARRVSAVLARLDEQR